MPRRVSKPERLLVLDENLAVVAAPRRPPRKRRRSYALRRTGRIPSTIEMRRAAPTDSIMRFRRLLMAALRVWELKHGIHDNYDSSFE
jgi:hypothetical protein